MERRKSSVANVCLIGWSGKSKGNIAQAKKSLSELVCLRVCVPCIHVHVDVCGVCCVCTCVVCESQGVKLSCECIVPSLFYYLLIVFSFPFAFS